MRKTLEALKEQEKTERAKADQKRYELIQHALDLRREQQKEAGNERKLVEKAIAELRVINQSREYVLGSFEAEQRGLVPRLQETNKRFERLARNREQWTDKFLRFPEESKGAIWSGRALNHFLERCGTVALEHEFLREQLAKEQKQYEALAATVQGDEKARHSEQQERVRLQQQLLDQVRGRPVLDAEHRRHIRKKQGMAADAPSYSGRAELLPIDWGPIVSLPGGDFQWHRDNVENFKERALRTLREEGRVDAEAMNLLMNAVEILAADVEEYRKQYIRGKFEHFKNQHNTTLLYRDVLPTVRQLKIDMVHLLCASRVEDVMVGADFDGQTVDELMVYMTRKGLRFDEARFTDKATYEMLYREMVRYYLTLHAVVAALDYDQGRVKSLEEDEQKLMETQYEDTLARAEELLQAQPPKSMAEQILTGLQIFNEGTEAIGRIREGLGFGPSGQGSAAEGELRPGVLVGGKGMHKLVPFFWNGVIVSAANGLYQIKITQTTGGPYEKGQTYDFTRDEFRVRSGRTIGEAIGF